ncbi:DUF6882 domain-containing protein [Actinomadura macrotermitis]|uniref:Uncharacterized protein n=1 Tax=Actinomadura macrotermitis TaxID=2585200 RepID=A0A7K0BUI5_9ACTN|nr:DUF6882 domain-containing protein [Actinomadura macrotermitis]MQY04706.1 hypothetical protein [Actinomadura macrotermitis]
MRTFSDALLELAAPHLAVTAERLERHHSALAGQPFERDLARGTGRVGDRDVRVGVLGSYAENRTFQWFWAAGVRPGSPGAEHAERLRALGEEHGVPELTEPLLDLGAFYDPRAAADDLAVMALGLLGAAGVLRHGHGGRALTFIVTDGLALPDGPSDAAAVYLRGGAALLGVHDRERLGAAMLRGYADHHGLACRDDGGETVVELPGGALAGAGPDGKLTAEGDATSYPRVIELDVPAPLPGPLLEHLAPAVACGFDGEFGIYDHLREKGWDRRNYDWDPGAGLLRFGDALELQAHEVGVLRPNGVWEWTGDAAETRSALTRLGAEWLAADRVDLGDHPRQPHVAELLARSAAHLGGARALWQVTDGDGEHHLAVTDPGTPRSSEDGMMAAIETAASVVQQLVLRQDRYPVMRAMVLGLFERAGLVPLYVGEPELLMGNMGLNQLRVYFSADGTVDNVTFGLMGGAFG